MVARDFLRSPTFVHVANLSEFIQMRRSLKIIFGADLRIDDIS